MAPTGPEYVDVMVLIANPPDFISWPIDRQIDRYARVREWHDFVAEHNPHRIPWVWGTHQVISHTGLSDLHSMHIAVYRSESLFEFDRLIAEDPLRHCSRYTTFYLAPLKEDHERDVRRFERQKRELLGDRTFADSPVVHEIRQQWTSAPDYVGKYPYQDPPNETVDVRSESLNDDSKIRVLIAESNSDWMMNMRDADQLQIYEKVLWWGDYASMLISQGKLSHGWTLHNFCSADGFEGQREGAVAILSVDNIDQFDELYATNPVRRSGKFWSVMLQPIQRQRQIDERMYQRLTEMAGRRTS
jgi:hypothetical protein